MRKFNVTGCCNPKLHLAGVHDIKNIRRKIRPEEEHKINSPWNIAEDFHINMSFSMEEIMGMLKEYENDYHTGTVY